MMVPWFSSWSTVLECPAAYTPCVGAIHVSGSPHRTPCYTSGEHNCRSNSTQGPLAHNQVDLPHRLTCMCIPLSCCQPCRSGASTTSATVSKPWGCTAAVWRRHLLLLQPLPTVMLAQDRARVSGALQAVIHAAVRSSCCHTQQTGQLVATYMIDLVCKCRYAELSVTHIKPPTIMARPPSDCDRFLALCCCSACVWSLPPPCLCISAATATTTTSSSKHAGTPTSSYDAGTW